MKVLIIEDEPFAQQELKRLLSVCAPEAEVLDCLDSAEDSVLWLSNNESPDLILLDIQLSDGTSFQIFEQITVSAPIIFITAYNEYALQAFRVNSIDYLLKPIDEPSLRNALQKLTALKQQFSGAPATLSPRQIEQLLQLHKPEYKSRFVTSIGDRIRHINVDQIAYFFAEDNMVYLVTHDRKKYIIDYTLDQLDNLLNPKDFFRITRRYLVHISSVGDVIRYFNSRLKVGLQPPVDDEILISRVRVPRFLEWMGS